MLVKRMTAKPAVIGRLPTSLFGSYFLDDGDRGRKYRDADFLTRRTITPILRGYLSYVA